MKDQGAWGSGLCVFVRVLIAIIVAGLHLSGVYIVNRCVRTRNCR